MGKYEKNTKTIGKALVLVGIGVVILMASAFLTSATFSSPSSSTETGSLNKDGLTANGPIYITRNNNFTAEMVMTSARSPGTIYVGGTGPGNYSTIQAGIDAASEGDTVFVYNGTYYENVIINKTISLMGEDKNTTIIDGSGTGDVIYISADWVNVSGFNMRYGEIGVHLYSSSNSTITDCVACGDPYGISIDSSFGIRIGNTFASGMTGIRLSSSSNAYIINCSTSYGNEGVTIISSSNNTITNCTICGTLCGVYIKLSSDNNITYCDITNSSIYGLYVTEDSHNNWIYHNNLLNNAQNAYDECSNFWDDGTGKGNYWSDYDEPSEGAYDNNTDGIVDTPYAIPGGSNHDNYPFIEPSGWEEVGLTPHALIYINGNANFASQASSEGWTGDGTEGNPYIIENYDINASTAHGIYIENTDVYFVIRNCTTHDGKNTIKEGIYFYNVSYGIIDSAICYNNSCGIMLFYSSNNSVINCTGYDNNFCIDLYYSSNNSVIDCMCYNGYQGLSVRHSSNNNIINCILYNNSHGIYNIHGSNNNQIINCVSYNNAQLGIYLHTSLYTKLIDCEVYNNTYEGIYINCNSNNTQITNCSIYNSTWAVYMEYYCSNSTFTNCKMYNNEYGVHIWKYANNNTFINSEYYNNSYGIYIRDNSNNNHVYRNNFTNNTNQAYDECSNYWDYNGEGNYWDDYTGVDNDGDGIGDTPYNINGGANIDNYPLIEPVGIDTIKPKITITGVENNTYYNVSVTPMVTIFDLNPNTTTITLNGVNFTSGTPITEDGTYTLFVQATDKMNNPAQQTITFTIDKIAPTISLISPYNNSVIKPGRVLDFEINDDNLWNVTYFIEGAPVGAPQLFSSPYNITTSGWGDGTYNITIFANDLAGNEITNLFVFIIDGTKPTINITGITNDEYYNTNVTPFITISDAHLNEDETVTTLNGASFVSGTTIIFEGGHKLYVYVVDKAGNNASQTITFTIDKTKPIITISGVEDGAYYNTDVAPVVDVSDANINTTSITLSGNPFASGTTISAENTYTLVIQANDKAANNANKTITFIIDKTTPTITIAESSKTTTKNSFTMHWSASEDIQYYEVSTDGVNWVNVSMAAQHTFTLSKGANTLYVRGTDLAGNKGTNMITVTYKKEEKKGFIPSFELIYLISALSLVLAFKRRKRI